MSEVIDTFLALTRTATQEEVVVWYNALTSEERSRLKAYVGPIIAKIVEAWETLETFKEVTSDVKTCPKCGGYGWVVCPDCHAEKSNCARCQGRGTVTCPACDGDGLAREEES